MINFGPIPIGAVLPIFFDSFAGSTGASVTITGLAATDIEVYKGTSMTQRSSDAGYTLLDTDGIDLDGVTGIQGFSIDTGDNTDAGFYASGSFYTVVVSAITVDSQTVSFIAATFRCVTAEGVAGQPKVDVAAFGGTAGTFASGRPEVNASHIAGSSVSTSTAQIGVNVVNFGGSAGTFASGRPEVNTTHAAGTAWGSGAITAASIASNAITSAKVAADAIGASQIADNAIDAASIATGAITSAKFAAGAIDAAAIADNAIDLATFAADAKALFGVIAFGTLQSVTNTTAQLASSETFASSEIVGATIFFRTATTGAGQARVITAYNGSTDTATFDALTTTPTGTVTYVVIATAPASTSSPMAVNVAQFGGTSVTGRDIGASVLLSSGTGTGQISLSSGLVTLAGVTHTGAVIPTVTTTTTATNVTTVNGLAANVITAASIAADAGAEIADAVWDEATAGHTTAGSTGKALTDASSAGDPWSTALPGAYGAGTAGKIIGDNLNATVGSRATQTSVDTIDDLIDTEVAAIKAKTDNLPASPAASSDCLTAAGVRSAVGLASANLDTQLDAIAAYIDTEVSTILAAVDTEVAAIKAKTDNLPASPAAAGDAMTLTAGAVDAMLDDAVEGSVTLRQMLRGFASALLAKASGLSTSTAVYRDIADTKNRIIATVDADGNRSSVTLDLS